MNSFQYTARLVTDAVISVRSTTTGGHRCLDYIPGACLLGAVAAKLYDSLGQDAFTVFHSGKVRFGNAYPLSAAGEPAFPVPFAWHAAKGEEMNDSVANVKNLLYASTTQYKEWEEGGDQQKQLREGYFTLSGGHIKPEKRYRLKTAINRERMGMAEESQLYGYQSLQAGSRWHFCVEFDADVSEAIQKKVLVALGGTMRIGRSRTAEYGVLEAAAAPLSVTCMAPAGSSGNQLALYCLSDVALVDGHGFPTLIPEATIIGLDGATFDAGRSYLRIRSYAPFNGKRRRFDLERQVIAKGSILVYTGEFTNEAVQSFQDRINAGIGLYRQEGLGKIVASPAFLSGFSFTPGETVRLPAPEPAAAVAPQSPLAGWLLARAAEQEQACKTIEQVERWVTDLISGPCPKNSQWGQLRNIAFRFDTPAQILNEIVKLCTNGVSQKQWSKSVKVNSRNIKYCDFLLDIVLEAQKTEENKEEKYIPSVSLKLETIRQRLYHLGNRIPRRSNQKEQRGDA